MRWGIAWTFQNIDLAGVLGTKVTIVSTYWQSSSSQELLLIFDRVQMLVVSFHACFFICMNHSCFGSASSFSESSESGSSIDLVIFA